MKRLLEISHMTWAFGGQGLLLGPGLNLNDLDEEKRLQAVAAVKAGIDEALEMERVFDTKLYKVAMSISI